MKPTAVITGGVLAVCLSASAPALAQNRVEQQMFLEIRQLQEENRQLMLAINTALEHLKAMTARIDAESSARSKGFADLQTQINATNGNLSTLQERISENKVQVQKATQELDAVKKGVDMLTVMVTQALAQMPANAPPVDPNAPPPSPPPGAGVPASSEDYYNRAFGDYAVGQWDLAIQGFQEYLSRFPDAPNAATAQRLIGESYFYMGKYQDAVAAFAQVVQKFGTSAEVPDAIYKQGVAYEQLRQRDQAIANYQLLRKDFPTSNAALQATQDLKRLGVIK